MGSDENFHRRITRNMPHLVAASLPPTILKSVPAKPMLWLTILGADGYWPIAALSDQVKKKRRPAAFRFLTQFPDFHCPSGYPTRFLDSRIHPRRLVRARRPTERKKPSHTTPAWEKSPIAFCVLAFLIHAILSCTGSFLSSSEAQAQFANTREKYRSLVVATGAVILVAAFVLIRCARSPLVSWRRRSSFLTLHFGRRLPLFRWRHLLGPHRSAPRGHDGRRLFCNGIRCDRIPGLSGHRTDSAFSIPFGRHATCTLLPQSPRSLPSFFFSSLATGGTWLSLRGMSHRRFAPARGCPLRLLFLHWPLA